MEQPDGPVTRLELRQELAGLRQELAGFEERLNVRMTKLQEDSEERLNARMTKLQEDLVETTRDMQTEIIRVFMDFQQRNESRDSVHEKIDAVLIERVASLEHRLLQIEKKLMLDPPAA